MSGFLFSSCAASYFFDEQFQLKEKIKFKDIIQSNILLEQGNWLDEEKTLIQKHNPTHFIGLKENKLSGIKITQDPAKLGKLKNHFMQSISEFYEANKIITKHKIKQAVTDDQLIIQTSNTIEELNKAINRLTKRLREWYGLYNPEFSESIQDHEVFVNLITTKSKQELLQDLNIQPKNSMGADFTETDLAPVTRLALHIQLMYKLKSLQVAYLEQKIQEICPNMTAITGSLIGAKLLSLAGSMKRMAKMPSSTIQLLGAEKALFRHLTKHTLPPKYGILHEHPLISQAKQNMHGKIARSLADKISIAIKVDYFKGEFIGDKLAKGLEKKFKR